MSDTATTYTPPTRMIPLTDWPKFHPWPSRAGLRHLINHRDANGADVWIVRNGRRVLVDEAAFLAWVKRGVATPEAATAAGRARKASR